MNIITILLQYFNIQIDVNNECCKLFVVVFHEPTLPRYALLWKLIAYNVVHAADVSSFIDNFNFN